MEQHFFVFAIRLLDQWLSWEEVQFYAALLDLPTVPVLAQGKAEDQATFENQVLQLVNQESSFRSVDVAEQKPCNMEGIVSRNAAAYSVADFKQNVFKYVRKHHVKTDEHWTRRWKRAPLKWESHVDHSS